ncbi:MAG: hypothetical protein M3Y54_13260, partial [Bacteroidota bacterium]|nr:hypothetical protein [Bacteroidota bacterium]
HQQYLWQLLGAIFRQLSQLEFIGKNKEGWQTFINENPVAQSTLTPASALVPETRANGPARWNPFNS